MIPTSQGLGKCIATLLLLLYAMFPGFALSLLPQHGHHSPSRLINNSHIARTFSVQQNIFFQNHQLA
jgi:hypothetical protein